MTMIDLDELAWLEAGATKGPWVDEGDGEVSCEHEDPATVPRGYRPYITACDANSSADAALIAASRNALPALIAELNAARDVISHAKALVHHMTHAESLDTSYDVSEGLVRLSQWIENYNSVAGPATEGDKGEGK